MHIDGRQHLENMMSRFCRDRGQDGRAEEHCIYNIESSKCLSKGVRLKKLPVSAAKDGRADNIVYFSIIRAPFQGAVVEGGRGGEVGFTDVREASDVSVDCL